MSLAFTYTPDQVSFFVLDFGNNSLLPLKSLPHTADALTTDQDEALRKLGNLLSKEMSSRKEVLGKTGISSIALFNKIKASGSIRRLPTIIIFIDNIDALKDHSKADLEALIQDISRDGQALSLYLAFSSARPSITRPNILANVKSRFILQVNDPIEITQGLGRTDLKSDSIPGRGLTRAEEVCAFQTALPVYGETQMEQIQNFTEAVETLQAAWHGPRFRGVPMMPAVLHWDQFHRMPSVQKAYSAQNKQLPIALDNENVQPFSLDFDKINHFIVTGTHNIGKTNFIKVILHSLGYKVRVCPFTVSLIDDMMLKLNTYSRQFHYLTKQTEIISLLEELINEVKRRKEAYTQKRESNQTNQTPAEFYAMYKPRLVIVNHVSSFLNHLPVSERIRFVQLLEDSLMTGVHFIFVSNVQDYPQGTLDKLPLAFKNITHGISFLPLNQNQYISSTVTKATELAPGEAHYLHAGTPIKIKIPLMPKGL
jgi:S-DNA-T family DNA segregation ATPase FtsK/SpoIIIE